MKIHRLFLFFALLSVLLTACGSPTMPPKVPTVTPPAENDTPIPFPPETPVLTWHRQGGIAGFCDDVIVLANGTYSIITCKDQATQHGQLTASQLLQLTRLVNKLQSFEKDNNDPPVADAMSIKIIFKGVGSLEASAEELETLNNFAALLLEQVKSTGNTYVEPVSKAVDFLAKQLGIAASEIKVTSFEAVEWSDACLGVVVMGVMCAQGITPGYRVVLEAQGKSYELHTNQNGDSIQQVTDKNRVKP